MEEKKVYTEICIKGGRLVKEDRIDIFEQYVLNPYFNLNSYVDMEIALKIIETNKDHPITEEDLESILTNALKRTRNREVWITCDLDQILEYTGGMLFNLGESDLCTFLYNYINAGKSNDLFERFQFEQPRQ